MVKSLCFLSLLCSLFLAAAETGLMQGTLLFRGSSFNAQKDPRSHEMSKAHYFDKLCDGDATTGWEPMETRAPTSLRCSGATR